MDNYHLFQKSLLSCRHSWLPHALDGHQAQPQEVHCPLAPATCRRLAEVTTLPYEIQTISSADFSLVQCCPIALRIVQVFAIGGSKVVSAREVFFGAHIEVIVMGIVQHSIQAHY